MWYISSSYLLAVCKGVADVVFVVDSSGSIRDKNPDDKSYDNWSLTLSYVADLVGMLDIGKDKVRVGFVRFGTYAQSIFYLNSYYDENHLVDAILQVNYSGKHTNMSGAIREMHHQQFTPAKGDRQKGRDRISIHFESLHSEAEAAYL